MEKISIERNLGLLRGANVLVVGSTRERGELVHHMIGKLVGARVYLCRERLDGEIMGEFITHWRRNSPENDLVILDGCFNKRAMATTEAKQLLYQSHERSSVTLLVGTDKLSLPMSFYRYFDLILIFRPARFRDRLANLFEFIQPLPEGREQFLFLDNRGEPKGYLGNVGELQEEIRDLMVAEEDQCCICLEEYCEEEILTRCLSCDNHIHYGCAMEWGEVSATCPLCRGSLDGCRRYRAIFNAEDPRAEDPAFDPDEF